LKESRILEDKIIIPLLICLLLIYEIDFHFLTKQKDSLEVEKLRLIFEEESFSKMMIHTFIL
jgi:hypothetical protein